MEDAKSRAAIRVQAAKRKETDEGAMGTSSSKPSAKKRPLLKGDRAPKKQKVSTEPVIGLMAEGNKTLTPVQAWGWQRSHGSSTGQSKETARLAP